MKSYNHLYEMCIDPENVKLAIKNVFKGNSKAKRQYVRKYLGKTDNLVEEMIYYFEHYENSKHVPKIIHEGTNRKTRVIYVPTAKELIVQHMIVNVLQKLFQSSFYYHSYASIKNKGAHLGKRHIAKFIQSHAGRNAKYYLKMDVQKYFDSIPHDILKAKLSKRIRDKRFLGVLFKIIDAIDRGIPIGFYTSQWLANWYLTEFDHWVKEKLGAKKYYRYMDDMVIFDGNKRRLHKFQKEISAYLKDNLGLTLKPTWTVARFDYKGKYRDLDFMGFRFYRDRVTIRKSILCSVRRKANRISKKKKVTIHDCRSLMASYSYFYHTNTRKYCNKYIKSKVDMTWVRKYIGVYDYEQRKKLKQKQKQLSATT